MPSSPTVIKSFLICGAILFFYPHNLFSQRLHLLQESTFEESTTSDAWLHGWDLIHQQYCCSYSLGQSSTVARSGSKSLKIDLRSTDTPVSESVRSELTQSDEIADDNQGKERWYGVSYYLVSWGSDPGGESILQWHDLDGSCPPISIQIYGTAMTLNRCIGGSNTPYSLGSVASNQWIDIVIHIKWTTDNTGFIQVWRDGTLTVDESGIRTNSTGGSYLKLGMNKWSWYSGGGSSNQTQRVFYIDDFRIGDETATYNDVVPTSTASVSINGAISMLGINSTPDARLKVPVTVKIYSTGNPVPVATYTANISQYGKFSVFGVPVGTYTISVKNSRTLQRIKTSQSLTTANSEINFGLLGGGDANNDNYVDELDFSILVNSLNKGIGESGYDARADFLMDEYIDAFDFSVFLNFFHQHGEEP